MYQVKTILNAAIEDKHGPLDSKSYTLHPSNLKFVPECLGVRESREIRLEEFYAHMWVIYGGRQM